MSTALVPVATHPTPVRETGIPTNDAGNAFRLALGIYIAHRAATAGKGERAKDVVEVQRAKVAQIGNGSTAALVRSYGIRTIGFAALGLADAFITGGLGLTLATVVASGLVPAIAIPAKHMRYLHRHAQANAAVAAGTKQTAGADDVALLQSLATRGSHSGDPLVCATAAKMLSIAALDGHNQRGYSPAHLAQFVEIVERHAQAAPSVEATAVNLAHLAKHVSEMLERPKLDERQVERLRSLIGALSADQRDAIGPAIYEAFAPHLGRLEKRRKHGPADGSLLHAVGRFKPSSQQLRIADQGATKAVGAQ